MTVLSATGTSAQCPSDDRLVSSSWDLPEPEIQDVVELASDNRRVEVLTDRVQGNRGR